MSIETLKARLQHAHGSAVRQQSGETRMNGLSSSKHLREKCESGESETGDASLCESDASLRNQTRLYTMMQNQHLQQKCESGESPLYLRVAHARAGEHTAGPNRSPDSPDSHVAARRPLPPAVTILKHCRCVDCRKFSRQDSTCAEGIGGTWHLWATGQQVEPADQWHYCAFYQGPQVSKDVWVWPRSVVSEERSDEASAQR